MVVKIELSKKKILITGGAGFIGSHLQDALLEKNDVFVIDNFSTGKREYVNKKAVLIEGNLKDFSFAKKHIRGFDIVFHLAANADVRLGATDPDIHFNENLLVTKNILEAMRLNGVKNIVFTSTSTVYGDAKQMPTKEGYGPMIPISLYGASKLGAEALITAYCHTFGMKCWIYRFGNVIGPRETHGIIVDFIKKLRDNPEKLEILGNGMQSKSYVYIADCISGILSGVEKSDNGTNILNLSSGDTISVIEIAEELIKTMRLKPKIRYTGGTRGWAGDVPKMHLDISIISKLGWKPKCTSKKAVQLTIERLLEDAAR